MFQTRDSIAQDSCNHGASPGGSRFVATAWNFLFIAALAIGSAEAQEYTFSTVAGGFTGDGGAATEAVVAEPMGLAFDAQGNLYVSESYRHRIRKISPGGVISTVAGTGAAGYRGNVRNARMAPMNGPRSIAIDATGSIYFSDYGNNRVRKVTPDGAIANVAGNGSTVSSGDGGAATTAGIVSPYGVALDAGGNLYVSETGGHRIRKITPAGVISTFAGTGVAGFSGDGGAATGAGLNQPAALAFDAAGNLYIADTHNHRVRKVTPGGVISTVAGSGTTNPNGDGGPATSAAVPFPFGVAVDAGGNLYIGDGFCALRKVDPGGTITSIAGGIGLCTYDGDGGPAADAAVDGVEGMAFAPNGDLYFAEYGNYRVRRIDAGGIISTIAGMGSMRDGSAAEAIFSMTQGLDVDAAGNIFLADAYVNVRVRKVTPSGVVSTFIGNGELYFPVDTDVDAAGDVYIVDRIGNRIRKAWANGGISTEAGNGTSSGYSGDGGPATAAKLNRPNGVASDAFGNFYIADTNNHRVRMVTPGGIITTVAGNGVNAFAGDNGAATAASLSSPYSVAVDAAGNLYIADRGNLRVRKVTPGGVISTVAGSGVYGYGGDGGAATAAQLTNPSGLAIDTGGNLLIAGGALRKVAPDGTITSIRGLPYSAYDVAVNGDGNLYISVLGGRVIKATPYPAP